MSRKAPNGHGTTRRLPNGSWQGQVTIPAHGVARAKRQSVYGKTQGEVTAKMRLLLAATALGVRPGRPPTLAEYGRHFLDVLVASEVQRGNNRETTLRGYQGLWKRHIAPDLGHLRLDELTPSVLVQWLAKVAARRHAYTGAVLSGSTQVRIYGLLRAALQAAYRDELIRSNPLDRVKRPRANRPQTVGLTDEEMKALLAHLREAPTMRVLVLLMAMTGARPGEALAASWQDVDLENRTWRISRSLTRLPVPGRAGSKVTLGTGPPKTSKSEDTITLPKLVVDALREHRARQAEQRLASPVWRDPDLVFASSVGSLLEPRNALREFKAAAAAAGITRNVRLHDLRHSAASALLTDGVDIAVISKLLRHSRLGTTSDIYSHLLKEGKSAAADTMDRRYSSLTTG